MKCYYVDHHRYVNSTKIGYLVKPCCRARTNHENVKTIQDIEDSNLLKEIKDSFLKDEQHPACYECWNNEKLKLPSKRLNASNKLVNAVGIEDWDIRPGNTCNLKCIMCDPHQSSKWIEDIDIYNETFEHKLDKKSISAPEIDWDYIKQNTINSAKRIYIAGGEPFYMKNALEFLEKLSQYEWNRKHTFIDIQTNGVSFNDKSLEILNRFDLQHIGFSIDGWKQVNEIIRYPTNWNDLYKNLTYFKNNYCSDAKTISVNVTVSSLNLLDIDNLIKNLYPLDIHLNELYHPSILHINSLKPDVIEELNLKTENTFLKDLISKYHFNEENNIKLKSYLEALDKKRGTNSKSILPWCWN